LDRASLLYPGYRTLKLRREEEREEERKEGGKEIFHTLLRYPSPIESFSNDEADCITSGAHYRMPPLPTVPSPALSAPSA